MSIAQQTIRPKNSGTKKIFNNPILERLSRTHISITITIFILISLFLFYYAYLHTTLSPVLIPFLFIGGFLFFTLMEYLAHRFLFHMRPTTVWKEKMQYHLHGVHHEYPKDKDRLAMPPPMSILLAILFFLLFNFLMDTKVFGFLPGLLSGYASYLFVHYIVHAYPPHKNFFKYLWINNAIHHYKYNTVVLGVYSPIWIYIFGSITGK